MSNTCILLYTTLPDQEHAEALARNLVRERLAACANILPAGTSIYEWKGELCQDQEVIMLVKTVAEKKSQCRQAIADQHPYDVPCILTFAESEANGPFAQWLREQTQANLQQD